MNTIVPLNDLQQRFCAWLREPDEDRARVRAAIVAEFKSSDGGSRQLQYLARMADGTA